MKEIKFNVIPTKKINGKYRSTPFVPVKGSENVVEIKGINEIDLSELKDMYNEVGAKNGKLYLPAVQMFCSGSRMDSSSIDYEKWNGCVFVDVDAYDYKDDDGNTVFDMNDIKVLMIYLCNALQEDMLSGKNFYFAQSSASGKGQHIVFYFDVEKSRINFKKCASFAKNCVEAAYDRMGDISYKTNNTENAPVKIIKKEDIRDMIHTGHVNDTCSDSEYQLMFISPNKIFYNEFYLDNDDFGEIDINVLNENANIDIDDDDYTVNKDELELVSKECKIKNVIKGNYDAFHNDERRRFLSVLCAAYGDDYAKIKYIYNVLLDKYVFPNNLIQNHTKDEILKFFDRDIKNIYKGNYPLQNKMMKFCQANFGIKFKKKFIQRELPSPMKYNEVIEIGKNEYLQKIIYDIYKNGHNTVHLTAGCGFGKTYSAKELSKLSMLSDIDWVFSGLPTNDLRICFITPSTAINKGNFDDTKGWDVIDSGHKDDISVIAKLKEHTDSICTTWNSFSLYNMYDDKDYERQFDVFIFDEIHSMYLYDYRAPDIADLKTNIRRLQANKRKVIMMTGTPSNEINEFNEFGVYKILVKKPTPKVPCDVVFYNEQSKGYWVNDLKEWISASKDNLAVVFKDTANQVFADNLADFYDLRPSMIYCSSNKENVDLLSEAKMFEGQFMLSSVYGQAGINIVLNDEEKKKKKFRIYILNTCGMAVVQYANRVRDRQNIDKIIIPCKCDNIDNRIIDVDMNTKLSNNQANKMLEIRNGIMYIKQDYEEGDIFGMESAIIKDRIWKINFGLSNKYISKAGDTYIIDERYYDAYEKIMRTIKYEKQTNVLYHRLVEAEFDVNIIYLDKDVPDKHAEQVKRKNRFLGQILEFPTECIKETRTGEIYLDIVGTEISKYINGTDEKNICGILTYLKKYHTDYKDKFIEMINEIYKHNKSFKKIDLGYWNEFYDIINFDGKFIDGMFLQKLMDIDKKDNDNLFKLIEMFSSVLFDKMWQEIKYKKEMMINFYSSVDEIYDKFKRIREIFTKYGWMDNVINEMDLNLYMDNRDGENDKNIIKNRKEIYVKVRKYLEDKHTQKGYDNGDKCKKVKIGDIIYDSIKEATEKTGMARRTIANWIKNGKAEIITVQN